jgi:hypothetical protein
VKDSITADHESKIRNLERELTAYTQSVVPPELTIPKTEYDRLDQELHSTRKRLDGMMTEVNSPESKTIY